MGIKGETIRTKEGYKRAESLLVETMSKVLRDRKPYKIEMWITPRRKNDILCNTIVAEVEPIEVLGKCDDGVS